MWGNRPHEKSSASNTKLPEEIFPLLLLNIFCTLLCIEPVSASSSVRKKKTLRLWSCVRNKTADWLWGGTLDSWTHTHTLNTQSLCSLLNSNTSVVTGVFCHLASGWKMLFCQARKQLQNQLLNGKITYWLWIWSFRHTGQLHGILGVVVFIIKQPPLLMNFSSWLRRKRSRRRRWCFNVTFSHIGWLPASLSGVSSDASLFSLGANGVEDIWNDASAQLQRNIRPRLTRLSWESFFEQKCGSSGFFFLCVLCKSIQPRLIIFGLSAEQKQHCEKKEIWTRRGDFLSSNQVEEGCGQNSSSDL